MFKNNFQTNHQSLNIQYRKDIVSQQTLDTTHDKLKLNIQSNHQQWINNINWRLPNETCKIKAHGIFQVNMKHVLFYLYISFAFAGTKRRSVYVNIERRQPWTKTTRKKRQNLSGSTSKPKLFDKVIRNAIESARREWVRWIDKRRRRGAETHRL